MPEDLPEALRRRTTSLPVDPSRLAELFSALRVLFAGSPLGGDNIAGIPVEELAGLLERMRDARYGVLTWAAADLTFAHAELAVQSMCELVKELNTRSRFAVLALGGSDGDLTAHK